jgi:hypothetical protein
MNPKTSLKGGLLLALVLVTAPSARAAQVNHVIHMSLDGLGGFYLQFFVTNAPARFTNFNRIIAEGASTMNARSDYDFTETMPNHVTIFTARPVRQPGSEPVHHGWELNSDLPPATIHDFANAAVPYKSSFFDVAHDYGRTTALIAGKVRFALCDRSYNATAGALDTVAEGGDNGRDKIDSATVPTSGDVSGNNFTNHVNVLVQDLTNSSPKHYTFIHLAEPDLTGHASGWRSAAFSNRVAQIDGQLGRILAAIENNPVLSNNTAFIITADHGGAGNPAVPNNHTDAQYLTNYTIPFLIWGPGVPANTNAYVLFANRADPGTNRTDYNAVPQPLRNADSGNLALAMLGLPPIPGSFAVPFFGATNTPMNIARALDGSTTVWWPSNATAFVLESADVLPAANQWQRITNNIVNNGGMLTYTASATNAATFYRLRKL